jgi:hypothetical protein
MKQQSWADLGMVSQLVAAVSSGKPRGVATTWKPNYALAASALQVLIGHELTWPSAAGNMATARRALTAGLGTGAACVASLTTRRLQPFGPLLKENK